MSDRSAVASAASQTKARVSSQSSLTGRQRENDDPPVERVRPPLSSGFVTCLYTDRQQRVS